jgi:guanine deaminase
MKLYKSDLLNPKKSNNIQFIIDAGILVDTTGIIIDTGNFEVLKEKYENVDVFDYSGKLITPGFIDSHCHLPQYNAIGLGKGTLLEWLNDTIFPLEAKFNDNNFAYYASKLFFRDVLSKGTTTIFVYSTIHYSATIAAFEAANEFGIRAYIGNSIADAPSSFGLTLSIDENLDNCSKLLEKYHQSNNGKLEYIITPRYAGNCSMELMKKASEIAKSNNLFMQTHLSENTEELELIKKRFPGIKSYTEVYNQAGILSNKSILAHCIYLNETEQMAIKDNGSIICHCPTSNRFLKSGIMLLTKYIDQGQKICFGSDVGAGYSLSMLHEAKEAIENSKYCSLFSNNEFRILSLNEAFYCITLGAAKSLGLDNKIGSLDIGKSADFLVFDNIFGRIDINSNCSIVDQILSNLLYCCDSYKITDVFVKGEKVL